MRNGSITYRSGRPWWGAPLLALLTAGLVGCGNLLEVENPNNVKAEDVENPVAAPNLANGAQRQVAFGIDYVMLVYATAADELDWVGSRDAWRELEYGKLSNGYNEFADGAFPGMAQGRWLADEAVRVLAAQQAAGTLIQPLDLARAYLWAAIAYTSIADMFDDWALSNLDTAKAPVGEAGMGAFYDTAIGYLTNGLTIATGRDAALALAIRAMRARSSFSRAIWDRVGVRPISSNRYVNPASSYVTNAVADAQAVLAAVPSPTWNYRFTFSVSTGTPNTGGWVNQRQEMRIGKVFAVPSATAPTWTASFIKDIIDTGTLAAVPNAVQAEWKTQYPPYTIVSAREMHLIIAEARLAAADTAGFRTAINNLRAVDGLTPYTNQVTPEDLLVYSRKVNLFLQGRALADHYRFRRPSPDWLPGSQALTEPGWFLPITAIECLSNPHIGASKCST